MTDSFAENIVKDFTHWTVYIHENQGYLGRLVIWCKRSDALDLAEVTTEEIAELRLIITRMRQALTGLFQPDWFNYAFLGNETRHLHGHLIPRYQDPKIFEGVTFTDERYGHNYQTNHSFVTPIFVRIAVRDALIKQLDELL